MTRVDTLVERLLHVSPAPHPDVATRGIPEPLKGVLGAASNILGTEVMGHVRFHRFEIPDLVVVQILESLLCGDEGQLGNNHVPSVVKSFDVITNKPKTLEVIEVIKDLAVLTRRVVTEYQRQKHPTADYLVVVVHVRRHLREFAAQLTVTDEHESCRNLAVQRDPSCSWFLKIFRAFLSAGSDPRKRLVVVAASGGDHCLNTVRPPGAPLGPAREGEKLDGISLLTTRGTGFIPINIFAESFFP
jgi:hypothetical protein